MRDRTNVEYAEYATFTVDGERINLILNSWTIEDIHEEYKPDGNVDVYEGWLIADYDALCREVQVFQSREEAALDLHGEDDPREVR
jgi:hypothetical protein